MTFSAKLAAKFAGREVIVIPDNDKAGRDGAKKRAKLLAEAGARGRLIELPVKNKGEDLTDWLLKYAGKVAQLSEISGP